MKLDLDNITDIETITIETEEGAEIECGIIGDFEFDGKKYMMVAKIEADDTLSEEPWCYGYEEDEEGISLRYIEDEAELLAVAAAFDELDFGE